MFTGGATTHFLTKPSDPQKAVTGSNFTFKWEYEVADADKANFEGLTWRITPSAVAQPLISVSSSGVPDPNVAPERYKGRVMWTGDISKFEASFVLLNVSQGDGVEYGIEINFGPFVKLLHSLVLEVLGKYMLAALMCCIYSTMYTFMDKLHS